MMVAPNAHSLTAGQASRVISTDTVISDLAEPATMPLIGATSL